MNEDYLRRRVTEQAMAGDIHSSIWPSALAQHAEQPLTGTEARVFYEGGVRHRRPEMVAWIGEPEFVHNKYL